MIRAFFTVFLTVFIAEIGDKTQLATMLFASEAKVSKWVIFAGSAAALTLAAAIGVIVGAQLERLVSPRTLKVIAGAGFIAIRQPGDASSGTESVTLYFDKQALKNAHELASFDESGGGSMHVPGKLDAVNARITINGPTAQVEAMVKQLNAGKVLSQLSEKRTLVKD